ncbi:chaperone NapD [Pseudomonas schmalbachii]|uniref:Chaperone NapD n=1 Tax=Pseudomonas schmalbachii TaxID=2816993 RepID=A0ABS3TTW1_9PSED|nr:chaperone NapD [Pseudomonas schmalbachii]MBO3277068.1 chaperone NapD [Pseudomonas schmalbachii]
MPDCVQIASLIVHARPEALPAVKANLQLLPNLEVHQESPLGKLVVVLEATEEAQILATLETIHNLPGVINAVLVYHEILESPDEPLPEHKDASALPAASVPAGGA